MKKEFVLKQIQKAENKIEDVKVAEILLGDVRKKAKEKILFLCYNDELSSEQFHRLAQHLIVPLKKHFKEVVLLESGIKPEIYEIQEKK